MVVGLPIFVCLFFVIAGIVGLCYWSVNHHVMVLGLGQFKAQLFYLFGQSLLFRFLLKYFMVLILNDLLHLGLFLFQLLILRVNVDNCSFESYIKKTLHCPISLERSSLFTISEFCLDSISFSAIYLKFVFFYYFLWFSLFWSLVLASFTFLSILFRDLKISSYTFLSASLNYYSYWCPPSCWGFYSSYPLIYYSLF